MSAQRVPAPFEPGAFEEEQAGLWERLHRAHMDDLRSLAERVTALVEATGTAVLYGYVENCESCSTPQSARDDARTVLRLVDFLEGEVDSLRQVVGWIGERAGESLGLAEEVDG